MNDILFGNNNNGALKRLAKADLKAHKLKTFLSGTVILIAVCLMAVVFMVLVNDALSQANSTPYHAMYQAVDAGTADALLNDGDFEAVGLHKNFGGAADSEGRTDLAYLSPVSMELLGFQLSSGSLPANIDEAAVSATYLKQHNLAVGDTFSFAYTDALTNQQGQKEFTVSGVIENKRQEAAKQFYILTSDQFRLAQAERNGTITTSSFSTQTPASVDLLLKLNGEKDRMGAEAQKEYLKAKGLALGIKSYDILLNTPYIEGFSLDTTILAAIACFSLFLMFASSLVIYSIFYISVINSIQMYAQMMSLGATEKQLRYFLMRQGNLLSLYFIPPGMAAAMAIAASLSGTKWIAYDGAITLISGLLIFIVIKAALRKPAKILAFVSPIEALKYTEVPAGKRHKELKRITPDTLAKNNLSVNRKKNRMAVLSLSVSGTLMIALVTLLASVNLPAMLLQSFPLNEDFQIGIHLDNFYERFPEVIRNNPLSDEFVQEVTAIPGVEKVIKDECVIGRLLEPAITDDSGSNTELIESVSPELLANVSQVVSGTADYEAIGTDGIIINKFRTDRSTLPYGDIKTGDTLRFQFDQDGSVWEKTLRVIGTAYFPSTGLFYSSQEVINAISPYRNVSHLSVLCDKNSPEAVEGVKKDLQRMVGSNPSLTLQVYADEYAIVKSFIGSAMKSLYGVSAFVIVFGLLNMINMLINSAIVRKREFALLQAVGMTNRQLRRMLYREGSSISIKAACIAVVLGMACGKLLCSLANEVMAFKFIIFQVSLFPSLAFAVLLTGLQMAVSFCISKSVERDTLTERLRAE